MGEQPIIPKPYKPMFTKKSGEKMKNRVLDQLELNQILREYFMLDPRLKRDINFNGYLDILGLKGSSMHDLHTLSNLWEDKRDMQQKNK